MSVKKLDNSGEYIMQGNIACAEGALAAGCRFFAGYPITPATEIAEHMAQEIFAAGGTFMQMEDELGSLGACIGASWAGKRAMTATSGPGVSLMQEGIGSAIMQEVPVVLVNVMRGGPSTGNIKPAQADIMCVRYGSHGDYETIALCPSSVQEMFDFTVKAFNLAEEYRVPVFVLADETVAHMHEKLRIPTELEIFDERYRGPVPCPAMYAPDERGIPARVRCFEGHGILAELQVHDERGIRAGNSEEVTAQLTKRLCDKILDNRRAITDVQTFFDDDMELGVIAYGSVARPAIAAVKQARVKGIKAGLLKVNTVWPFPLEAIEAFAAKAKKIIVPEMNYGQYIKEISAAIGKSKVIGFSKMGGALHFPEEILDLIEEVLQR